MTLDAVPTNNRSARARELAGLSVGQACRIIGFDLDREGLISIEESDDAFARAGALRERMADVYGVNPEWLAGDREQRDYAAVDKMRGGDDLTGHDRDTIAEFAAMMPRTPHKTLADILAAKEGKSDE